MNSNMTQMVMPYSHSNEFTRAFSLWVKQFLHLYKWIANVTRNNTPPILILVEELSSMVQHGDDYPPNITPTMTDHLQMNSFLIKKFIHKREEDRYGGEGM